MKVTIREVAEAANVSRGTVDRALNHRPGVNQQVAERIIKIAEELGYKPDMAARTLANKKYTKTIGVLLCSEGNPFFKEVIQGINNGLEEMGHFGIQSSVKKIKGFDAELQLQKIEELLEERISGLVITPVNSKRVAQKIQELEDKNIPVVTINTDIASVKHLAYVGCDYVTSGCVAGELLGMMSNGAEEHIALVIGSKMVMAQAQRLKGIKKTLKRDYSNIIVDAVLENEDDDRKSYEQLRTLLQKNPDLTTICFAAAGVEGGIKAVRETDYGRKLRIVTYDLTDIVKENLRSGVVSATVCQEPFRQGFMGVEILGRYLLYGTRPEESTVKTHIFIATKYNL